MTDAEGLAVIDRNLLSIGEQIGGGALGIVCSAVLTHRETGETAVVCAKVGVVVVAIVTVLWKTGPNG